MLDHSFVDIINNSVDISAREVTIPWGGTDLKIFARRAGALGDIAADRTLSTGRPVQGQRMDHETAPDGPVRFGAYTGPMAIQTVLGSSAPAVPTAPVGAVGQ